MPGPYTAPLWGRAFSTGMGFPGVAPGPGGTPFAAGGVVRTGKTGGKTAGATGTPCVPARTDSFVWRRLSRLVHLGVAPKWTKNVASRQHM
jgi:hypothetical protein